SDTQKERVFLPTETTEEPIIRTLITDGKSKKSYVFNKYVLLTDTNSDYCKAYEMSSGRFLTKEDSLDRNSRRFVSTEKIMDDSQTGRIDSHMLGTTVNVFPYGRIFDSSKADGLYYVELPDGESVDDFTRILQLNIEKESGIKIESTDLKGDVNNVGIPTRDPINYVLAFAIFLILFILLVFYYLLRNKRNVAIMRLMGVGTNTILKNTFSVFAGFYPTILLVAAVIIMSISKNVSYLVKLIIPVIVMYPAILLFFTIAFLIVNYHNSYILALKGHSFAKGILVVQFIAEFIILAIIIYSGSSIWNYTSDLKASMKEYSGWSAADDYGVFYPLYNGNEQTSSEELQREVVFGKELYNFLNEKGMIFARAGDFERHDDVTSLNSKDDCSEPYMKSFDVNPNYLKKFPVYDTEGNPVAVNENETALVLIVPERYKNEKEKIVKYYKNSQLSHREADEDYYGQNPELPKQQEVKIIWAASSQKVFTFDPEINDSGKIDMPLITVLTEGNSYVCQRQGILGNGNTDPCKILLDKNSVNTYRKLLPELKKLGIDDNLKAIVSINEKAEEEQALSRSNLRLSLITMLIFLTLAIFLIYQSSALVFAENKVRYTIMSVFGIRWTHIYKSYLLLKTGALALICIVLGFIDRYSSRLYLMVAFLFLIAVQYLIIYMCTDRLQRKNTVSVLKGE
ncbi:MAG: DUF1430 domain-containing protein, partial [Candidatus Weimeria sp.]